MHRCARQPHQVDMVSTTRSQIEKPLPVRVFIETTEKWIDAIHRCDLGEARFQARQLRSVGQLLAVDPEFLTIYQRIRAECVTEVPAEVIDCVYALLMAVSDAGCSGAYRQPRV